MSNIVKYVLFDLDGTLLDSLGSLYSTYQSFLESHNLTASKEEFDHLNGPSIIEAVSYFKKRYDLKPSNEELLSQYRKLLKVNYQNSRPFDDSTIILENLKNKDTRMLLVSSSLESDGVAILDKLGWNDYFESLVWGDHVKNSKPAPDIYKLALQTVKEDLDTIIVIEDSCNGVRSASACGLSVFALERDSSSEELISSGASKSFKSLTAIVEYLKNTSIDSSRL